MTCRRKNSGGETGRGGNKDEGGGKPPPTERAECLVGFVDRVYIV